MYRRTCRAQLQHATARRRKRGVQPRQAHAAGQNAASAPEAVKLASPDAAATDEPGDAQGAVPEHAPDVHDVSPSNNVQPETAESVPHRGDVDSSIDGPLIEQLPAVAFTQAAATSEPRPEGAACKDSAVAIGDVLMHGSAGAAAAAEGEVRGAGAEQKASSMDSAAELAEHQRELVGAPCGPECSAQQHASIADGASPLPAGDEPLSAAAPDAAAAVEHAQPVPATPVSEPQPQQPQTTGRGALARETQPGLSAAADDDTGPDSVTDMLASERSGSVPDAAAAIPEESLSAEPQRPGAQAPGSIMHTSSVHSEEGSDAEGGVPAAEAPHNSSEGTAPEPEQCYDAAAAVKDAQDAQEPLTGAGDVTAPRWPVLQLTEEELSSIRQRLEQQPHDPSQGTPHVPPVQHAVTATPDGPACTPSEDHAAPPPSAPDKVRPGKPGSEPTAQPETPLPSRLARASPSDTTELSQDEPAGARTPAEMPAQPPAETPAVAHGKQEDQSVAMPAVDAGADSEAAEEQPASCVRPQQAQTQSQAAPAEEQATAVTGGQRVDAAPQAAATPAAGPSTPDEPAAGAGAILLPPALPQQAAVKADVGDASPVPAAAVDHSAAVTPPPPLAAHPAAQPAPCVVSEHGTSKSDPPCPSITGVSGAAPQRRAQPEGVMQHDADIGMEADDVDIEATDTDAAPAEYDAAASALVARLALRKEARALLAPVAGCSRAVPQHAIALIAGLWDSQSAVLGGVDAINSLADATQRRRVAAACWRDQAERRGCSRAVSRADVTALVGLLSPADSSVEPPQVSLFCTRARFILANAPCAESWRLDRFLAGTWADSCVISCGRHAPSQRASCHAYCVDGFDMASMLLLRRMIIVK